MNSIVSFAMKVAGIFAASFGMLIATALIVKFLGIWQGGPAIRLLIVALLSFVINFMFTRFLMPNIYINRFVSLKWVLYLYVLMMLVSAFLALLTYVLMTSSGDYGYQEISSTVLVFVTFLSYFLGGSSYLLLRK